MSDRGLRYWLSWPHTRQDHVVAFALMFGLTLVAGYLERPLVTLLAAVVTVLVGIRLMAWDAEKAAAGEEEDAPLTELLGMGGSWDRRDDPGREGARARDPATGREEPTTADATNAHGRDVAEDGGEQEEGETEAS